MNWQGMVGCDVNFALTIPSTALGLFSGDSLDEIGEPVMSGGARVISLLIFGVLSALLILPCFAYAQSPRGDSTWAVPPRRDSTWTVLDVTAAINGAIEESNEGVELREKVVRRFSECSLMYGGLSTLASDAEAKKNYVQAQKATAEIEWTIAKPLQSAKRLEIEESARRSVALMLRTVKAEGTKEVGPLLRNCKALNDVKEIKNALRELPP
jgi:hypothetical protein